MAINTLEIAVDDLEATIAKYDRIQVWRSTSQNGTYEERTAATPQAAVLQGDGAGPWGLSGAVLTISVNGADTVSVTFSGTDPLDLQTVINQINAVFSGLASEGVAGLCLTSPTKGTGSSLLVGGSPQLVLGLPSTKTNGKAARLALTTPTAVYRFRDFDGSLSHWYKTRFYASKSGSASEFSGAQQSAPQSVFSNDLLAKATVLLADGAGRPIVGRRIIFVPTGVSLIDIGSGVFYGSLPTIDRLIATTNDSGYAEMPLVIGSVYRAFFEGSAFFREFRVPETSEFDLLSVMSTAPDVFSIVQSPPMPIRMS